MVVKYGEKVTSQVCAGTVIRGLTRKEQVSDSHEVGGVIPKGKLRLPFLILQDEPYLTFQTQPKQEFWTAARHCKLCHHV